MYSAEAAVQESRADRLQSQNKKLRTTVEAQQSLQLEGTKKHFQTVVEAKQSQLDDIKKQLEFQCKTTSPLKKQISSHESLHRTNRELKTATEKSAKKERKAAKKAKASYDAREEIGFSSKHTRCQLHHQELGSLSAVAIRQNLA